MDKNNYMNPLGTGFDPTHEGLSPLLCLSATAHHECPVNRSLCVHTNEIVLATNSGHDWAEMNICELNELDSSVRSTAIGGFRQKHCPESGECLVICK